ncbi:carboxypeptidase-like regulatory domain-containing protein [Arcticibacter sp. MXS-1]|uniref:TonB-dependent receptor n=1 Tax=Arcticibacter sp. MXS-1 TaxID=3341726 RepID=UPI0035A9248D
MPIVKRTKGIAEVVQYLLLTLMLAIGGTTVVGQTGSDRMSASFSKSSLGDLASFLKKNTGYTIFYDPRHSDSLAITLDVKDVALDSLLKVALKNTDYFYGLDQDNRYVFISYKRPIVTSLPPAFTDQRQASAPLLRTRRAEAVDLMGGAAMPAIKATLENKVYEIGAKTGEVPPGNVVLAGYVRYLATGEPVIGASVVSESPRVGVVTNQYGYYSLSLPRGRNVISVSGIGIRPARRQIVLYSEGRVNIEVIDQVQALKEVVISSDKAVNVRNVQMGIEKLSIQTIKQVPTVFGETDVLRVVLTLPGVKSAGEASTGFNVRGGAADQNLILYNDATIYNPSHFFGFFSAFNAEGVKDVELYKSSIPAYYGGRLSSVLAVTSREGNKKKFTGSAGIGLLTSRFNIEGPIWKDRTSFMFGGRTTYSNWLLKSLPGKADYKNSDASFSDLDIHVSHQFNEKNNLYVTGYYSNDKSNLASDTTFRYNNQNVSVKWKHVFNNKLFSVITGGYDGYRYNNYSNTEEEDSYRMKFDIRQLSAKADFNYYIGNEHTINTGLSSIHYSLNPGTFTPEGGESLIVRRDMEDEKALESAVYINEKFDVSTAFTINAGIRYSLYQNLGPKTVSKYAPGLPVDEGNLLEIVQYKKGETIKTYHGPEYRLSARYAFGGDFSIKAGYNTMRQYIHMLSNTTAIAPTDIWKLSDLNIKPQHGDQVSIGLYKNFKSNTIETSVEGYYKRMKDYLDYKSGASLVLNEHIERDVMETRGKAYGLEFMIKKLAGKMNGWVSYTYSRTLLKTDNKEDGEIVNGGNYYPGSYDKPHDFTLVGNFKFSHRYSFSLNTTYSTGRPITLPVARYWYGGGPRLLYSDRNGYRIPDYFRVDFGINIAGNHKVHQFAHNSFTLGVYNLTGRKNAYSTYFVTEGQRIKGYKLSIFGSPVPYINYNIRF